MQRIVTIGNAVEKYNSVNGRLPRDLAELTPHYIDPTLLRDPWGNAYKYLQRPERYLVIGFSAEGKADTDLFLSRTTGSLAPVSTSRPETGGITLVE